ncbi:phage tail protein [Providencia rettgeri]|uniref:phage tail protein n=1 Tax=Providencia rettgeri TaxID=587 RepID=UPI0018E816BF|nr:phage tail protein [Providencia rettgeri]QQE95274.1 phage tail protein [Providencia rettgeri]QWJ93738.1 phage tail protein [Providencia rettgeri]HEM6865077.1 phage tail protein [Providencia rettgeri]
MTMKGKSEAIRNLNIIVEKVTPIATAQAINRIAARAISRSVKQVSKETKIPQKIIRKRVRLKRASSKQGTAKARITVNRGNLPAIVLGTARVQLSRSRGTERRHNSVLKVGKFTFPNAFIQQLNNGRWHVMQRVGKSRYPIEVVKIPLSKPLTDAFEEHVIKVRNADIDKEVRYALNNQLRLYFKGG